MTRSSSHSAVAMMRRSILWTAPVALGCLIIAAAVAGLPGAIGATLGATIVGIFFMSSPLVLGPIAKVSPQLSMVVALTFFMTKVVALVALVVVLLNPDGIGQHVHEASLGGTLIVCTIALTAMQLVVAKRSRQTLYDLDSES